MKKIALTAALIATTMSTAALAADWVLVSMNDEAVGSVDRTSIKQVGSYKRAWDKIVYNNHPEYKELVSLTEYDCAGGRSRDIQTTGYYQNGKSDTIGVGEWRFATPDSTGETKLNYVCFGKLK
jgi:hypothetical protein